MLIDANPALDSALPLAEIALNAAIELDGFQSGVKSSEWLMKLADALTGDRSLDMGLFPVYDQALMSSAGKKFANKADLYAKLRDISGRLGAADPSSGQDTTLLRDFCVALHDALLSQGYVSHYKTVSNSRFNS